MGLQFEDSVWQQRNPHHRTKLAAELHDMYWIDVCTDFGLTDFLAKFKPLLEYWQSRSTLLKHGAITSSVTSKLPPSVSKAGEPPKIGKELVQPLAPENT